MPVPPHLGQIEDRVLNLPGGWRFLPKPGNLPTGMLSTKLLPKLAGAVTWYYNRFGRSQEVYSEK